MHTAVRAEKGRPVLGAPCWRLLVGYAWAKRMLTDSFGQFFKCAGNLVDGKMPETRLIKADVYARSNFSYLIKQAQ